MLTLVSRRRELKKSNFQGEVHPNVIKDRVGVLKIEKNETIKIHKDLIL